MGEHVVKYQYQSDTKKKAEVALGEILHCAFCRIQCARHRQQVQDWLALRSAAGFGA